MKRFEFSLERVLEFRRLQAEAAEAALERMVRSRAELLEKDRLLVDEVRRSFPLAAAGVEVDAAIGEAAVGYRDSIGRARVRLGQEIAERNRQIERQRRLVLEARQRREALEKLKERRLAAWEALAASELEELAADAHRAKMHAVGRRSARSGV